MGVFTSGIFYIFKRHAIDALRWSGCPLYIQGGGECVTEEACAMRALNDLGSSIEFELDGSRFMVQYQAQSIKENPEFWSWNHDFIRYCTGDMHFGSIKKPGRAQWGWAHFSGAIIVDSVIEDCINNYGLGEASTVVWSGDSAGGIGSLASVDRIAGMIPSAKVCDLEDELL